jgi:hypothetical protein
VIHTDVRLQRFQGMAPRSIVRLRESYALPFVGAARPHTPRLPPLLLGLTPAGECLDPWITYDFERALTAVVDPSQGVDNTLRGSILRNQVAQFSMPIWLKVRCTFPSSPCLRPSASDEGRIRTLP